MELLSRRFDSTVKAGGRDYKCWSVAVGLEGICLLFEDEGDTCALSACGKVGIQYAVVY